MKKYIAFIMTVILSLSLCACMKSKEATAMDEQILALGEITLSSNSAIEEAEKAWKALTDEQKEEVENYAQLTEARSTYEHLVLQDQADQIDQEILGIGTVTLEKKETILKVEKLFNDAAPDVQALVKNKNVIDSAIKTLDEAQVKIVEDLIADIGEVTLESKDKILKANKALYQLPENLKANVTNKDLVEKAITSFTTLSEDQAKHILSQMYVEYDKINQLTFYSPKELKRLPNGNWISTERCFILPYLGIGNQSVWLRLLVNYTGDDWVFFKYIITLTDSKKYTTTVNYRDVIRDNAWGDVWEYIDLKVGENELNMLRDIAGSKETIVRFQGDKFVHDFTVKDTDKQAIQKILDAYDYYAAPYYINHPEK